MGEAVGVGYLAQVEANRVAVRAAPDVVFVRLIRDFPAEHQRTAMFCELTPGHAIQLIRELQEAVGAALSRAASSHVE